MSARKVTENHFSRSSDHLPPSLAGASVGDEVLVERILLDIVRSRCHDCGISVGDRLRVEERSGGEIVVRNSRGRSASLPGSYAFYVYVERCGATLTEP